MSTYRAAVGHGGLALVDLDVMVQQPTADLVAPVQRDYGASGANHNQGKWVCWHFDFIEDITLYVTILTQLGLQANDYAAVTIYTRDERGTFNMYQGIAHFPEPTVDIKQNNFFLRDVDIYITDLVLL
jgi:hypothetical protein